VKKGGNYDVVLWWICTALLWLRLWRPLWLQLFIYFNSCLIYFADYCVSGSKIKTPVYSRRFFLEKNRKRIIINQQNESNKIKGDRALSQANEEKIGIWYTALSYLLWGILPLYWKLLESRPAMEILAHRIIWSFFFMVVLLIVTRQIASWRKQVSMMIKKPKLAGGMIAAAILISANWFVYIWAVTHGHVVETSLGYYINPLVSVVLGMVVLKERLNLWQWISFILASAGVCIMTFQYGAFPWVALSLAFSFGIYGLVKKLASVDSAIGLTVETMVVAPVSFIYLFILYDHSSLLSTLTIWQALLLIGAGPATAVPLLYFAKGARRISLTMLGFLQYIAPTLTLLFGVFLFHEAFTKAHVYAFSCIWAALVIFSFSKTKWMQGWHDKIINRNSYGI
jgi:chloramphenicol-sensitive protein RarD